MTFPLSKGQPSKLWKELIPTSVRRNIDHLITHWGSLSSILYCPFLLCGYISSVKIYHECYVSIALVIKSTDRHINGMVSAHMVRQKSCSKVKESEKIWQFFSQRGAKSPGIELRRHYEILASYSQCSKFLLNYYQTSTLLFPKLEVSSTVEVYTVVSAY